MTQNDFQLFRVAILHLIAMLHAHKLTLDQLEKFLFDEQLNPSDTVSVAEPLSEVESLLRQVCHKIFLCSLHEEGWNKIRTEKLQREVGQYLEQGKLTPSSIATLCNTSVVEFQRIVDDDEG